MIDALGRPPASSDLDDLARLLVDAVDSGAGVSFMRRLTEADARAWWRDTLETVDARAVCLVARDDSGIAGTVQLQPAWAPNQPHRADIAKLIVHRRARGRGIGRALVAAIEGRARDAGFTLLTLDTVRGDPAERVGLRGRMAAGGRDPRLRAQPHGALCDTVVFYKEL